MEQESDIINTLHQLNRDAILEALQQLLSSISSQKHYVLHETNQMICRIQMISQQFLETLSQTSQKLAFEIGRLSGPNFFSSGSGNYLDSLIALDEVSCKTEISQWIFPDIQKILENSKFFHDNLELSTALPKSLLKIAQLSFSMTDISPTPYSSSQFFSFLGHESDKNYYLSFDIINNSTKKSEINFGKMVQYPLSCNIPGNYLFIGGGRYSDTEYSDKFYLWNPVSGEILYKTHNNFTDHYTGVVFYEWDIYMFGGTLTKNYICSGSKYSLKSNTWGSICDIPSASSVNTPIVMDGKIFITGINLDSIYYYVPKSNLYGKINRELNQGKNKVLLMCKRSIFLLYEDKVYESTDPLLGSWEVVTNFKQPRFAIKETMERGDEIYFRDYGNLFRMNTNTKEIVCLIDSDYS